MSTTALEIDAPQLGATQLVAHPGTLPTITIPVVSGRWPDPAELWRYLREPADFFGVPMPAADQLGAAIAAFVTTGGGVDPTSAVLHVTIADAGGTPQILVSGTAVTPVRRDGVRITGGDHLNPVHRATDPWWRRMAARTTSRGDVDQIERWLTGCGFVDTLAADVPLLGALVWQSGDDLVGVENPEPTSILEQLERSGAISGIGRSDARPAAAECAWWISPRYETHPVGYVDGLQLPVDLEPPFARWS